MNAACPASHGENSPSAGGITSGRPGGTSNSSGGPEYGAEFGENGVIVFVGRCLMLLNGLACAGMGSN